MIKLGFSGALKMANEERERAMQTGWVRFFNSKKKLLLLYTGVVQDIISLFFENFNERASEARAPPAVFMCIPLLGDP